MNSTFDTVCMYILILRSMTKQNTVWGIHYTDIQAFVKEIESEA